ncbi:MAG: response regulator [Maricaulaceae bacterium]|jgi:two-component system chemotaxis response regulator CheY
MDVSVMIVDDSLIMIQKLEVLVRDLGYSVVRICRNGEEAVRDYASIKPDIVMMDITMPGMDGIDALIQIRERDPDARIIMVTSHGQESMVVRSLEAGAVGYVLKPVSKERLEAMVTRATKQIPLRKTLPAADEAKKPNGEDHWTV